MSAPTRSTSWLVWLLALLTVLAVVGSRVFGSNLALWLVFVVVVVAAAGAAAARTVSLTTARAGWLGCVAFVVIPAVVGFFAWRTSGVPQWGLRYLTAAVIGLGGGVIVASGVFEGDEAEGSRGRLMQFLHAYRAGANTMAGALGALSAALVFPTVIISVVNVVLRRVGANAGKNLTSNALIEAQWYLYALIFIFGFAYILRDGINVRVDFWFGGRSSRTQSIIDLAGHAIGLLPLAYIGIKYSWPAVEISWANKEASPDAGGLYRPPIKTALMMGFVFLAIQGVAEVIKNIEILLGHEFRHDSDNPALAGGEVLTVDDFDLSVAQRGATETTS